ncbi:50S ribosomal protein L23 [Peptoniphilus rhinitidis]|uniref:50S ribosomal protein L23 n=1 Tax=Peptoniphilus rhinitidis TaxID=1175452 RepID=UPI0029080D35|nr:50S ribosomal protein L23 [Peptoniphilus rhinitidis]MDU5594584.1 50S ribosomal protein L23 [Peptoniphilus rhinitidis]
MNRYDIIKRPLITEQSMDMMADNKYSFVVEKDATKPEIRKAVEEVFGVTVEKVYTMNMRGKLKRQGVHQGRRPSWKKAIVKLTDDSEPIEFFDSI